MIREDQCGRSAGSSLESVGRMKIVGLASLICLIKKLKLTVSLKSHGNLTLHEATGLISLSPLQIFVLIE